MIRDARKTKPVIALLLLLLGTLLPGACSALRQDRHAHGPYWSPDGRRVLFTIIDIYKDNLQVTGRHICVLDLAGDARRIWLDNAATNGAGGEVEWSPNGQRLAFSSGPGVARDVDIFVLDIQTRKVSRLTQLDGISLSPQWSPDGSRLAFMWYEEDWQKEDYMPAPGVTALYVVNADGNDLRELVRASKDEDIDLDLRKLWSPDGKKLVFSIDKGKGNKLYVADVDTGQINPLTDHSGWYESDYRWSPNSQWIAFTSRPDRESRDAIYVVDANGRNLRYVVDIEETFEPIRWAPDSVHLAFFFESDGKYVAYITTVSGNEFVQLTGLDPTGRLLDLDWSPDGHKILAEYIDESPLYIVDVATRTSIPAPPPADSSWILAYWSPDGRWIAASTVGSNKGVFLINPENGKIVPLRVSPNDVSIIEWMPDGERVAFVEYPEDEQAVIYIVGLDGEVLRKIEADCKWPLD